GDAAGVADRAGVDVGEGDRVGRRAGDRGARIEARGEPAVDGAQAQLRVGHEQAGDRHVAVVGDEVAVGDRVAGVGREAGVGALDDADRRGPGQGDRERAGAADRPGGRRAGDPAAAAYRAGDYVGEGDRVGRR